MKFFCLLPEIIIVQDEHLLSMLTTSTRTIRKIKQINTSLLNYIAHIKKNLSFLLLNRKNKIIQLRKKKLSKNVTIHSHLLIALK